jgi:hypothetical protein
MVFFVAAAWPFRRLIGGRSHQHPALHQTPRFTSKIFCSDANVNTLFPLPMDSLLSRLNSRTPRLILVALVSSTLTALTILSIQTLKRDAALSSLKQEAALVPPSNIHRLNSIGAEDLTQETVKERIIASRAKRGEYDDELIMEQLARNRSFFGDEGLGRIRKGFVIVVGAGGVGSWAATMLARSGIGTTPPSFLVVGS